MARAVTTTPRLEGRGRSRRGWRHDHVGVDINDSWVASGCGGPKGYVFGSVCALPAQATIRRGVTGRGGDRAVMYDHPCVTDSLSIILIADVHVVPDDVLSIALITCRLRSAVGPGTGNMLCHRG